MTPEAQKLLDKIRPKIKRELDQIDKVPISVLLWGPDPSSSGFVPSIRVKLRDVLRSKGHAAVFSEEISDTSSQHSLRIQEFIQAKNFDLVICFPSSPGCIAEVHQLSSDVRVCCKMLVFIDENFNSGFSSKAIEATSTVLTCQVEFYQDGKDLNKIMATVLNQVQRIRELRFMEMGKKRI